ncbi:MAG: permease, partial [Thermoguttaceae bacterium]
MNRELKIFVALLSLFLVAYFLPVSNPSVQNAILNAFILLQWYVVYHTLNCVIPAIFIAGALATFLSKESILKHLGPNANPIGAYGVASVSGTILAVCSCSVLPMFAGIYRVGAGLGPAMTFLCAGPALNVMAIFLTARVLGWQLGTARTIAAISISIIVGVMMACVFRKSEKERVKITMQMPDPLPSGRKLWQTASFLGTMILILIFASWANPNIKEVEISPTENNTVAVETPETVIKDAEIAASDTSLTDTATPETEVTGSGEVGAWATITSTIIFNFHWYLCLFFAIILAVMIFRWFTRDELHEWMDQTWFFAKQIIPLLFGGVFVTGFVTALLSPDVVANWVGGTSLRANAIA